MFHRLSFSPTHGSGILSYDVIPSLDLAWRKKRARCLMLKIWRSELFYLLPGLKCSGAGCRRESQALREAGWKGRRSVLVMRGSDPLCPLHPLAHRPTPTLSAPALWHDQGTSRSPSLDLNKWSVYLWEKQSWTKCLCLSRPGEKVASGRSVVLIFREMSGHLILLSTWENQRMDEERHRCVRPSWT